MFRSVHLVKDDPKRIKWVEKGRKSRVSKVHCRSLVQNSLSGSQDQMILQEPRHSAQRADLAHFPKCRIYSTFIETRLFARTPMRVILFLLFIGLALAACNNSNRGETNFGSKPVYDLNGFSFALEIPENWSVVEDSVDAIAFREECPEDKDFCTNLVIRIMPNDSLLHLDEIAALYVHGMEGQYGEKKMVSVNDAVIGGLDSKVIDYKLFEKDIHLGSTAVFIIKDTTILGLYFAAENKPEGAYPEHRKIFFDMLKSLEL